MANWRQTFNWGNGRWVGEPPTIVPSRGDRLANLYCPNCGGDLYLSLGACRTFEPCPLEHCKRLMLLPGYGERPAIARRVEMAPNGMPAWPFDPCAGVS